MKLKSEGTLEFEMEEKKQMLHDSKDDVLWRYRMLENSTKTTVLMEQSCTDHREFRKLLYRVLALVTAIAIAIGVPIGLVV